MNRMKPNEMQLQLPPRRCSNCKRPQSIRIKNVTFTSSVSKCLTLSLGEALAYIFTYKGKDDYGIQNEDLSFCSKCAQLFKSLIQAYTSFVKESKRGSRVYSFLNENENEDEDEVEDEAETMVTNSKLKFEVINGGLDVPVIVKVQGRCAGTSKVILDKNGIGIEGSTPMVDYSDTRFVSDKDRRFSESDQDQSMGSVDYEIPDHISSASDSGSTTTGTSTSTVQVSNPVRGSAKRKSRSMPLLDYSYTPLVTAKERNRKLADRNQGQESDGYESVDLVSSSSDSEYELASSKVKVVTKREPEEQVSRKKDKNTNEKPRILSVPSKSI